MLHETISFWQQIVRILKSIEMISNVRTACALDKWWLEKYFLERSVLFIK